ncbi:PaaI family thioesterase [Paracoccus sp. 1_MG-2023]|uniref:PaaI family thioesterase n=1 Tax=unclassified Paracoccus (in: a-proteobacteria) TaxID=2688777 RepID=UPI001C086935|nr:MULTISPECIES: PaaI family thioesterase [unclassified Paracoccus (in: a-proteobacteria)]MBU2957585.1 PaaI family thioesterase [Paracoccus sp. C2R09]MDO6669755.1 PaaI family thioesterase [Paracoccus sp. 1_MG-2023]
MTMAMDAEALNRFLQSDFPQVAGSFRVDDASHDRLTARLVVGRDHLRPGGTVSGPSMFALADLAVYCMVLARIGPVALAVTTNASIDFMRKPAAGRDLVAECRLLKLGRVLAVADVLMHSDGQEGAVARCSMTYSIPPAT